MECDAGTGQAYKHIMRQLTVQPGISVNYVAVDPAPAQTIDPEVAQRLGISTAEWSLDSAKPAPERASGADLVVLENVLHRHGSIATALSAAAALATDGGFVVVVEPTRNFAVPWSFWALTHDVTALADGAARTCGPFCDEAAWSALLAGAGLTSVAQKSDGVLQTVFLCRKVAATRCRRLPPRIIDVDDESFGWLEDVKAAMAEDRSESGEDCSVWLKATKADSGLVGMLNCLRREPNGDRLR